jgi:hypothetical protein
VVATKSYHGVDIEESSSRIPVSVAEILDVFGVVKPKASKTPLIRIGGDKDGSYLVPEDLEGIKACFSPGVNRIKYFEDYLAENYGIESHMCDFTCDVKDFTTPLKPGLQTFQKKWLDVAPGGDNLRLDDWVKENAPSGDLLLQMDIEGAEYRNILGASDETLARFRVMVLELHGMDRIVDPGVMRSVLLPFFQKLGRNFTAVHAHPNNCCGDVEVPGTDIRMPRILELTLVRNDRFISAPGQPSLPHPLDITRNVANSPLLFLNDAWSDNARTLEARLRILEDSLQYGGGQRAVPEPESEFGELVSLMAKGLHTAANLAAPADRGGNLAEVAAGSKYQLSSAYGNLPVSGTVHADQKFFFHTRFGAGEYIRIDLGRTRRIRRIEITNRRDGFQSRARYPFVQLAADEAGTDAQVLPVLPKDDVFGAVWDEAAATLPGVAARFVTLTTPLNTALHFADVRIYAEPEAPKGSGGGSGDSAAAVAAKRLKHTLGSWADRSGRVTSNAPSAKAPSLSFIVDRTDGLGHRLMAMVWARALSRHYKTSFAFTWKEREGGSAAHHATETAEAIFSSDFIREHWLAAAPDRPVMHQTHLIDKYFPAAPPSAKDPVLVLANVVSPTQMARVRQELGGRAFARSFERIGFSPKVNGALRAAREAAVPKGATAIHLRAGDIVYGPFRCMSKFSKWVLPFEVASAYVAERRAAGEQVVIFGQDVELGQALAQAHGAVWSGDLMPGSLATPAEQAMFDVGLMARCSRIVAGTSGFAQLAALIAGIELTDPTSLRTPRESVELIRGAVHPLVAAGASDLQRAFSLGRAAQLVLEGGDPDPALAVELLAGARELDPVNGFFPFLAATVAYQQGRTDEGEQLIASISQGDEWGELPFLLTFNDRPTEPYLKHLSAAADAGAPWASLIMAFGRRVNVEQRRGYAAVALQQLTLAPTVADELKTI